MNGLLDELGKKVADRWLTTLLLPGLLWVCTAVLAWQLRWAHALDPTVLEPLLRQLGRNHPAGQSAAVVVGALIAAAGVAMSATGVGAVIRAVRPAVIRSRPAQRLRAARVKRWDQARLLAEQLEEGELSVAVGSVTAGPRIADARARQYAISLEKPEHATWVGDRMRANAVRIHRAYGLDINLVWPRLWVVLPDWLRADIAAAQGSYNTVSILLGWAVLYSVLGLIWGPALLVAAVVLTVSSVRARSAAEALCQLVETATDLYGPALAEQLRIPCNGALTPAVGSAITEVLGKAAP